MGNLRRYFEEGLAYFVTTVTKDRVPLFRDPKFCRILLVTIEYYKTLFDYHVHAYCLMPDHVHLILTPNAKFDLSFIIKMIKGSFARKVNRLTGKQGSLWQRRFFDEVIRDERQLLNQLEYIHQNPVKATLVSSAGEYPYSSFNQYQGLVDPENQILKIEPLE